MYKKSTFLSSRCELDYCGGRTFSLFALLADERRERRNKKKNITALGLHDTNTLFCYLQARTTKKYVE